MAKRKTINIEGTSITLLTEKESDYISLTDIDHKFEGKGRHIENWLRNKNTIEYLGAWELLHNPDFNSMQFHEIEREVGRNRFLLSAKKWSKQTNAIGLKAKAGRYGGTYAHPDIAFHFCLWLNPVFQLYIAKEFQRLKQEESTQQQAALEWNLKRSLTKVNYRLHTDAVKNNLIPKRLSKNPKEIGAIYANEADLLNLALFGTTAKEWRLANPEKRGNIRDTATTEQLIVLANLESHNAQLIKEGYPADLRLVKLNEIAIYQMEVFSNPIFVKELE